MTKKTMRRILTSAAATVLLMSNATVALAHDGPDDGQAAYIMADWMLLSFLVFFVAGLLAFAIALKRGLMTNVEDAKYYMLTIDEPDYYTPEWAKEEPDETVDDPGRDDPDGPHDG